MCHLWPSISPHGPEVPNSVWNLRYGVWLGFARATDQYIADMNKQKG